MNQLDANYFWRRPRKEVDFITGDKGEIATEVKLSGQGRFHFSQYAADRNLKKALVITKNNSGTGTTNEIQYDKIPAWAFCAGAKV